MNKVLMVLLFMLSAFAGGMVGTLPIFNQQCPSRMAHAMTLKEWLDLNGMTMAELSRQTGIFRQSIERYVNDGAIPSIANMKKIAEFTRHQVKPDDFYAPWFMQGG